MRARASVSALGELEGGGHPASPVFLKAQGQREGARGRGDDDGDFRVPGVEGAHAYVYRGGAPGAGGEVDVCEGGVQVGQEPAAQLGRLPGSGDDLDDGAGQRRGPGTGVGQRLAFGGSVGQADDAGGGGVRDRALGAPSERREGLGWECAGLVWARDVDAEALRGLGVMCVLMASPGEW